MSDQKTSSADQQDPSPMDAEQRRRMREAAEAAARVAEEPLVLRGGGWPDPWIEDARGGEVIVASRERGAYVQHALESRPSAVLALLDALEQAERERDELRERLAAAERQMDELVDALPKCEAWTAKDCTEPATTEVWSVGDRLVHCDQHRWEDSTDLPLAAPLRALKAGGAR
jgi:hypothetical protein